MISTLKVSGKGSLKSRFMLPVNLFSFRKSGPDNDLIQTGLTGRENETLKMEISELSELMKDTL